MERLELTSQTEPCEEECPQVGEGDYVVRSRANGRRFIAQLYRMVDRKFEVNYEDDLFEQFKIVLKSNAHDYGTYFSIEARWDRDFKKGEEIAYWLESNLPERWDD
jgi:hypothetical protein